MRKFGRFFTAGLDKTFVYFDNVLRGLFVRGKKTYFALQDFGKKIDLVASFFFTQRRRLIFNLNRYFFYFVRFFRIGGVDYFKTISILIEKFRNIFFMHGLNKKKKISVVSHEVSVCKIFGGEKLINKRKKKFYKKTSSSFFEKTQGKFCKEPNNMKSAYNKFTKFGKKSNKLNINRKKNRFLIFPKSKFYYRNKKFIFAEKFFYSNYERMMRQLIKKFFKRNNCSRRKQVFRYRKTILRVKKLFRKGRFFQKIKKLPNNRKFLLKAKKTFIKLIKVIKGKKRSLRKVAKLTRKNKKNRKGFRKIRKVFGKKRSLRKVAKLTRKNKKNRKGFRKIRKVLKIRKLFYKIVKLFGSRKKLFKDEMSFAKVKKIFKNKKTSLIVTKFFKNKKILFRVMSLFKYRKTFIWVRNFMRNREMSFVLRRKKFRLVKSKLFKKLSNFLHKRVKLSNFFKDIFVRGNKFRRKKGLRCSARFVMHVFSPRGFTAYSDINAGCSKIHCFGVLLSSLFMLTKFFHNLRMVRGSFLIGKKNLKFWFRISKRRVYRLRRLRLRKFKFFHTRKPFYRRNFRKRSVFQQINK
eukprot:TRINITY_DN43_c0_g7_i1.p1 TRINITY_DN43_c0_g7~~TRINITY_DN43_c0_g7_i1.p1  ORF type:complete len:593 (-),score=-210.09 TRINITY_DN43_c0_g7_i1:393-2120(-)